MWFSEGRGVFGYVSVLQLSVASIEVVNDVVLVDDVNQKCSIECEKNGPRTGPCGEIIVF